MKTRASLKPPCQRKKFRAAWRLCLAFAFAFLQASTTRAQLVDSDLRQFAHTSWRVSGGDLPVSPLSIAQGREGFLWLGTETGIFQFDGVRFRPWQPENAPLPEGPFGRLCESDAGLWIGGQRGVHLVIKDRLLEIPEVQHFQTYMVQADGGDTWIGGLGASSSDGTILFRYKAGKIQKVMHQGREGTYVADVHRDHSGTLWVTTNQGIWRLEPGPPQFFPVPDMAELSTIVETADGHVAFQTQSGLKVLSANGDVSNYLTGLRGSPHLSRDGALWTITPSDGLMHYLNGRTDSFSVKDGLSGVSGNLNSWLEDREGSVWVITGAGLDRFRRYAVPTIREDQGLANNLVRSVLEDNDGSILAATANGLQRIDASGDSLLGSSEGVPRDVATALFRSRAGDLYLGTPGHLFVRRDGRFSQVENLPIDYVQSVVDGPNGTVWILDSSNGIVQIDSAGKVLRLIRWQDLRLWSSTAVWDSVRNGLWIASEGADGSESALYLLQNGKPTLRIAGGRGHASSIWIDNSGDVWAGFRNGLLRWNGRETALLNAKSGLPCDTVNSSTSDGQGLAWLYTGCGLVSVPIADLQAWSDHPERRVAIVNHLDEIDGAPSSTRGFFYSQNSVLSRTGKILFATASGIAMLDPKRLGLNSVPPPVLIEGVEADQKLYSSEASLVLPSKTAYIRFLFTALSLAEPKKVRFQYKLEGYDHTWHGPVSVREAEYSNLPPGHYTFVVRAANNDGVWSQSNANLAFQIPPTFTQTATFELLLVALAVVLVLLLFWLRLRRLAQRFHDKTAGELAERDRIARELHDTLLQGFHGLLLRFDVGIKQIPEAAPGKAIVENAMDRADELLIESRRRIQNLRSVREVSDIASRLRELVNKVQSNDGHGVSFRVDGTVRDIGTEVSEEIFSIASEAIANAIRHASASEISTVLDYGENALSLSVMDDGVGLPEYVLEGATVEGHWGIIGMRERASQLGGTLQFLKNSPRGAMVVFRLSSQRVYTRTKPWYRRLWDNG